MELTGRGWRLVVVSGCVLLLGVLAQRLILVTAGIGLGGWLLAQQLYAVRAFASTDQELVVETTATPGQTFVDDPVQLVSTIEVGTLSPITATCTIQSPVGAASQVRTLEAVNLDSSHTVETVVTTVTFPTPGEFRTRPLLVQLESPNGLFTEEVPIGDETTVSVEARYPDRVHIGEGGDAIVTAYGDHEGGRGSGGTTPAELRQYTPGDAMDRIDWNATARLNEPYVREFETETDQETHLIVDHRGSMDAGRAGQTALAYAKIACFRIVDAAETAGDPLGCRTVGPQGVTETIRAGTTPGIYEDVRARLRELTPLSEATETEQTQTAAEPTPQAITAGGGFEVESEPMLRPAMAQRQATRLAGQSDAFTATLQPFFESRESYVTPLRSDPLFGAVERLRTETSGRTLTVICTDDTNRQETREAVGHAAANGTVLVFLTPRVLFAPERTSELESQYHTYVAFEEFRQELARLANVRAYEVAPGDRLEELLAARSQIREN